MARIVAALLAALVAPAALAQSAQQPIRLADAAERGTFNIGTARAALSQTPDADAGGEVVKLDYTLAPGTTAGAWAKGFPENLNADTIDVVRLSARAPDPGQPHQVSVTIEIKGTRGVQRIAVPLQPGWTFREDPVAWQTIGTLTEVVVLVSPTRTTDPVEGTLYLDLRFEQLPALRKLSTFPAARIGGVLLVSLLIALLTALIAPRPGQKQEALPVDTEDAWPESEPRATWWPGLKQDIVRGMGAVFLVGLAVAIYLLGERSRLQVGWTALLVAAAGAAVAEWWKYGLTGKHLTLAEAFQDAFILGLLAASVSPIAILQRPTTWSDLLLLSPVGAASAALLYQAINAHRLVWLGRHIGVGGAILIAAPYAVGLLLLLQTDPLVQGLGARLTGGTLPAELAAFAGRVAMLFCFNELVANGLALATKRTMLTGFRGHLTLASTALAAVAAPWVADVGSGAAVASGPTALQPVAAVLAAIVSQAALWAEVYIVTGMLMNALGGQAPTGPSVRGQAIEGMKKGAVFSGVFLGLLHLIGAVAELPAVRWLADTSPVVLAALACAVIFPLLKTIIESFDGSQAFFRRVRASYRKPTLYLRGIVVGVGVGSGVVLALQHTDIATRAWFGFGVGLAAYAGVNLLADVARSLNGRGHVQPMRVYLVQGLLGGAIGAGVGFYFDHIQLGVVLDKFQRYLSVGTAPADYGVYPFLSKWGYINVGVVTGGASLMFAESLAGVISWAIPAWLFALNRTFMAAYFQKETTPITGLFTREGLARLMENMLAVLRWGLWMSPIIHSFLRPVGDPTWYNQDGLIRTFIAIFQDIRLSPEAFRAWSLQVFIALLAYDAVRILIWLDHMGLRVATLVNLSFLGMDRLEERLARFLGRSASARCIPEGVKRFATWAPLLIPFYIPRGQNWDYAWSQAEAIRSNAPGGLGAALAAMPIHQQLLLLSGAMLASTALFAVLRWLRQRFRARPLPAWSLANTEYEVTLKANGEVASQTRGYDVSRRSYDLLDPAGRALFLVDVSPGHPPRNWPVVGNFPAGEPGRAGSVSDGRGEPGPVRAGSDAVQIKRDETSLSVCHLRHDLRSTVTISLPDEDDPVELWTVTIENLANTSRHVKVVPYLEWVLNRPDIDRGHTQYNRLFAEMEYVSGLHAILAQDRHSRALGLLAADIAPEGFLTARVDFIGRARSLWTPRVLETLAFSPAHDEGAHPTFDPIGSLLLGTSLAPGSSAEVRLLIGLAQDKKQAIDLIARHLHIPAAALVSAERQRKTLHPIGHGEIPPGTPQPYAVYSEDGRTLLVRTPFTPRPYDHTLSNAHGHIVSVTNRGLNTTASWNSQQNRLTPDWPDTVTREVPPEAFYLFDPETQEWFSPTYHPLNDSLANHEVEFGMGSATFHMTRGTIQTNLTVFVPPEEPVGVYLLTVLNHEDRARRLRLAPYFQMVLAGHPEHSGPLQIRFDQALNSLFFVNPRNTFRTGPAFVSLSCPAQHVQTRRGHFFGRRHPVAHPYLVEYGEPDTAEERDDRPIAAFLTELEVPARGEWTGVVLLGQTDDRRQAEEIIGKYCDPGAARRCLEETGRWWRDLMDTLRVQTTDPEFDRYLDWLKYQALAERIWARRGFYQASGAFGFRDQLQDAVNLMRMDPLPARKQLLLHASQQFLEGDVVHWFHLLPDGRTGFSGRTHASDNLLWLAWGVVEYVLATGDESLLHERTAYLEAEQPFEPLPAGKHGSGFVPLRSSREDTVYRHCMKAIDLVLDQRLGAHGLPLIGTGDWNDGLDEIGSQGKGESVWLGFFLYYILDRMADIVGKVEGPARENFYRQKLQQLRDAVEWTWRGDRYLRAIHDDGTEIGVAGSGIWEIDALTAAWAVLAGINPERGRTVFETALQILEKEDVILLGWPPLRDDKKPYLGRSSKYPEGVRENGMYCHGVQWLVGAARILAEQSTLAGNQDAARRYLETAYRLWLKISPLPHVRPETIETYGGQPNKQAADLVTTFDPGRMIWNGYTGAAGWVFRQALEGVLGLQLKGGEVVIRSELTPLVEPLLIHIWRDVTGSPLQGPAELQPTRHIRADHMELSRGRQNTQPRGSIR